MVRCDLDVPIVNGEIVDTGRLDNSLDTLNYITDKKAIPVIIGHMGRPKGIFKKELSTLLLVPYFDEKIGKDNYELVENLRFDPREEQGSKDFAAELSKRGKIYINEAFSTCHREHTSITFIPEEMPSYAGIRLQKEVEVLSGLLEEPQRPFAAIIGGAKLESKKPVISKFLQIADEVLVGGRIGMDWEGGIPENLHLPVDYARDNKDIGPVTVEKFTDIIKNSKTVVWSGPMGVYEEENFISGTKAVADAIIGSGAYSVLGGGDTAAAVKKLGIKDSFSFISSGGSAMLEFLVRGTLPGLEALGYNG